ncbi:MAG: phosphatidylglycerophosphatase A [Thermodesulfovibrionales bacterium]|nr:phosphatidylglycerophosphatase A [Thermodesulfovibrionales bacterium]
MIAKVISSFFLIGYIPFAPGTVASITTVLLFFILKPTIATHIILISVFFILGILSADRCESIWGKDNKKIVIDEFVGQAVALISIPINFINFFSAFILFRFFDILKPPPIRNIERSIRGGLGVMLDDVLAGIFANLCLQIMLFLF